MSTLAETFADVAAESDHREVVAVVAGRPTGEGWVSLANATQSATVFDEWFDAVRQSVLNHRTDVTGSYLASFVGDALVTTLGRALLTRQRAWRYEPATTWLRLAEDGWFDAMATSATVLVLPTDPAATRDDVEIVSDVDEMTATAWDALVDILTPVFAMTRERAPYGRRGMWSSLADSMASDATWLAHVEGRDVAAAWESVVGLVDALADAAPTTLTRPTFDLVEADGHTAHLTTRGTCCLYYRSLPDDAPEYCTSCPLGTDDERAARRTEWLRRDIAGDGR